MGANSRWPFPGETPVVRARRVAHAYRALALDAGADVRALDERMHNMGERWAAPQILTVATDDWLTANEAGDFLATSAAAISALRRRGRLTGRRNVRGHWEYRAGDLAALSAEVRSRKRQVTDTLHGNGSSVPA